MKNWLVGAMMLSAVPMVAGAQSCAFEPEILAAADRILEIRPQIGRMRVKQFGADAVYFKLRFGGLDTKEGLALIERVGSELSRPPRRLDWVTEAYVIAKLGVDEGLAYIGPTKLEAFAEISFFGARALILSDGGARFIELDRALQEAGLTSDWRYNGDASVATAITDQPDSFLRDFAVQAEAAGALNIAGYVLSLRADLTDYIDFLQRVSGAEDFEAYPNQSFNAGLPLLRDREREKPLLPTIQNRSFGEGISYMHSLAVQLYGQEAGLLSLLLSQSPQYVKGDVARAFLAEMAAGNEGLATDADIAWDFILREMVLRIGAAETFHALKAFNIGYRVRHYDGLSLDTLSWASAKLALLPYMRGEVATVPERPDYLPPEFGWAQWVQIAQMLREGGDTRLDDKARVIAAELLFSSGDTEAAFALLRGLPVRKELRVMRDFMVRLARQCGEERLPGQSRLVGAGSLIYSFAASE